jgi:hypothetical protein
MYARVACEHGQMPTSDDIPMTLLTPGLIDLCVIARKLGAEGYEEHCEHR